MLKLEFIRSTLKSNAQKVPRHHGARRLLHYDGRRRHSRQLGHGLRAAQSRELSRVSFDELERVSVGQSLEGLDDLRVLELVLAQQTRLDVLGINVFVHVTNSESFTLENVIIII